MFGVLIALPLVVEAEILYMRMLATRAWEGGSGDSGLYVVCGLVSCGSGLEVHLLEVVASGGRCVWWWWCVCVWGGGGL